MESRLTWGNTIGGVNTDIHRGALEHDDSFRLRSSNLIYPQLASG